MSKKLGPFMPLYWDDFIAGTTTFGADEVGAYLLLLHAQWVDGAIDPEPKMIERVARCEYGKLSRVLRKFVELDDGTLRNERLHQIRIERIAFTEKASRGGKKGMARRWAEHKGDSNLVNKEVNKGDSNTRHNSPSPSPLPLPLPSSLPLPLLPEGGGGDPSGGGTVVKDRGHLVQILASCRPEYQRISTDVWLNAMKLQAATMKHLADAATIFVQQDANLTDPLRAPAKYFAGILRKVMESDGVEIETWEEQMERLKREA